MTSDNEGGDRTRSPLRAKKRFGQHFLHDDNIVRKICAALSPRSTDHIVEIGPGPGALTHILLQHVSTLDVIEIDNDVIPALLARCSHTPGLRIHNVDVLRFDLTTLSDQPNSLRLVGNLPYNISTPLLFHIIDSIDVVRDMHFMFQKEVVDRLVASPGNKDYGRLSVMVQYFCSVSELFRVRPGSFSPPPKVDSAVARLVPHSPIPHTASDFPLFQTVVRDAFSQRRKTLRNALKRIAPAEALVAAGLDPKARPETVSPQQYVQLANTLAAWNQQV